MTAPIPYGQIRALYDNETITVYQAYSATIADVAVKEQKLYASPEFKFGRMTWIKPSWCWMMYRSGYSLKDDRQARILGIKMRRVDFERLLGMAVVVHGDGRKLSAEERKSGVRVQWDPERGPGLGELPYRSIQIGIGEGLSRKWAEEWIVGIEDVTEKALKMKDAAAEGKGLVDLVGMGLVPVEKVYEVSEELRGGLKMDQMGHT